MNVRNSIIPIFAQFETVEIDNETFKSLFNRLIRSEEIASLLSKIAIILGIFIVMATALLLFIFVSYFKFLF